MIDQRFMAAALALAAAIFFCSASAADKSKPARPEPPHILLSTPLALAAAATNQLSLRGLNLTNVDQLRFTPSNSIVSFKILAKDKTEPAKSFEAQESGDTLLRLQVVTSANSTGLAIAATSPAGASELYSIPIFPAASIIDEKEPNGSFRQAQPVHSKQTVRGCIQTPDDVDVYLVDAQPGQQISVRAVAAAHGSLLDPLLSVFDKDGNRVAVVDDSSEGKDAALAFESKTAGPYYICITDANSHGSDAHPYLLTFSVN